MKNNASQERLAGIGLRALAVISFIAILSIGMWGSVQIAKAVPNVFSSLAAAIVSLSSIFIPANTSEQILLSAPALTVSSGENLTVSWEHANKTADGSYTFRYNCAEGVHFVSADSEEVVFCNVPFHFLNDGNTVALTPISEKNRFIDVTLFIDFTPNGGTTASVKGSMVLTIVNEDITTSPNVLAPTKETSAPSATPPKAPASSTPSPGSGSAGPTRTVQELTPTPVVSDPNGQTDLIGRILEVGVVNKTTNVFAASSTPYARSEEYRVAIRFAIENIGTKTSPQFTFNAVLPSFPSHIFSSAAQQELRPGDRIEYTLAFDQFVDTNEGLFTLNIDPSNRVNEPNKDNNLVKYTIRVTR